MKSFSSRCHHSFPKFATWCYYMDWTLYVGETNLRKTRFNILSSLCSCLRTDWRDGMWWWEPMWADVIHLRRPLFPVWDHWLLFSPQDVTKICSTQKAQCSSDQSVCRSWKAQCIWLRITWSVPQSVRQSHMVQLRSLASGDLFNALAALSCVCIQKHAVMSETQMTHRPQGDVVAMKRRESW